MATPASSSAAISANDTIEGVLQTAFRIRSFERTLLELFKRGLLSGTVHTCVGQELCAAALHPHLRPGIDAFFATHRGHGHYLAHGGPEDQLLAELMGRSGALCLGRGGTQNLFFQRFFSAGIQGGSSPIGVGFAWAMKRRSENGIAVVQLGDGTLGEGTLYEAFTFAAVLRAPVLFLLECNGWAQSTDVRTTTPGDIVQRAQGFGLETNVVTDEDPLALYEQFGRTVDAVRQGRPTLQVVHTRRLFAHSKGDDDRPAALLEDMRRRDPLTRLALEDSKYADIERADDAEISELAEAVAVRPKHLDPGSAALPRSTRTISSLDLHADRGVEGYGRVAEELNAAFHQMMEQRTDVILIGEDLLDPYGGAFKVSRGLSTKFPSQVFSTPIAEAAIVGLSNGLALAGLRPVAEIMFADFVTLATDQLVNFAAKFHYMYAGKVTCPLTLRLVSGGGRGYGPTHSQSLERLFCGVPGLRVVAISNRHHPGHLLTEVVLHDDGPTVFVEHKALYGQRPTATVPSDTSIVPVTREDGSFPPLYYKAQSRDADVTVVTYGGMTSACESAMASLFDEDELAFDYIVLTQLWPLDVKEIIESVRRTKRLVVVEESTADYGLASAVIAQIAQVVPGTICRAVGAKALPIPSVRHLEDEVLPNATVIRHAIHAVL